MPLQRGNPFSLQGDTQQNIVKMFVLWLYLHPDEWKWFPHLLSFLFSFSGCCFPTLLHSLPLPGFARIYLLLPAASPSIPGDKLGADCRAGLGSSTATPASPAVDAGSDNSRCVSWPQLCGHQQSVQTTVPSSAVPCAWLLLWGTAGTLLLQLHPTGSPGALAIALLLPPGSLPGSPQPGDIAAVAPELLVCRAWGRELPTSFIFCFVCWVLWGLSQKDTNNSMSVDQVFVFIFILTLRLLQTLRIWK